MSHPLSHPLRFAALLLLLCAPRTPAQVMYTPGSPRVDELRRLYALAGLAFPTGGFPVSGYDLAGWAADLDPAAPTPASDIEIAIRNRFSLEGYLRAGEPREDFAHEYLDRENLWTLAMGWSREDRAGFVIEAFLHREYLGPSDWNGPGSTPGNPVALENEQVSRGFLWYNFDPLQVEFGRDRVHFGPLRSSLLPSDRLPYLDLLRVTLPLGRLTMDWMVSSLENREITAGDVDRLALYNPDDFPLNRTLILANMHRFEYDFGAVRAAVSGFCLYARENNYFVLADFFPVFSWHATQLKPYNLSLVFEVEAVPLPGLRLMTQFGFDDVNTSGIGVEDADVPTIFAGIAGAEYTRPLGGPVLVLYAEGGYTHYLWGSYEDKWALARAIYRLDLDQGTYFLPLTSPYGPGTAWGTVEGALKGWRGFDLRLRAAAVFRNEQADLTSNPYRNVDWLGDVPLQGTLELGGEVRYRPAGWLEMYARPAWYIRADASWAELVLGSTVDLDWRRPVPAR